MQTATPILSIRNLSVNFFSKSKSLLRRKSFYATRSITLDIQKNETFCFIGESGSGKTTLARAILGLYPFQEGEIIYNGRLIKKSSDHNHQRLISNAQMVFQDPEASLSPFLTLSQSIEEPLRAKGFDKKYRSAVVKDLAKQTGLSYSLLKRHPSEVSGGQNQRACIARALSTKPDMLFLDEPLTALDTVIRKEVADMLCRMKDEYNLTYFLITHDFGLVKKIGTTVAVMYMGRIVEKAPKDAFFSSPRHPYSQALLSSVLKPWIWHGSRVVLEGDIPSPLEPPSGCVFHPRCSKKKSVCEKTVPEGKIVEPEHEVFCHLF